MQHSNTILGVQIKEHLNKLEPGTVIFLAPSVVWLGLASLASLDLYVRQIYMELDEAIKAYSISLRWGVDRGTFIVTGSPGADFQSPNFFVPHVLYVSTEALHQCLPFA